jgi:hypothetical protein
VRLHDVTVPHGVLPNPETIAEQNRHSITSMSPRAPVGFRNHEHRSDATPFPYPSPRHTAAHGPAQSSPPTPAGNSDPTRFDGSSHAHSGTRHLRFVSHCREYITVFCSWDPGRRPPSPYPPKRSGGPHSAGYLQVLTAAKVTVTPFARG